MCTRVLGPTTMAAALALLLAGAPLRASTRGAGLGESLAAGRVITGATPHRIIHFTFDDGPDPRTTPRLLDEMDRLGVRGTFFFSASRFRGKERRNARAADIARDALGRGHSIGTHSVDHVRMRKLRPAELRAQLTEGDALFRGVFGERTFLFRPPFGSRNRALDRMLLEQRYTTVMWNVGLADWVRRSPEALARTFERKLEKLEQQEGQRGGVVLLHDTHGWSVDGFVQMVEGLQRRNCELLAGGEELYEIIDDLALFTVSAAGAPPGTDAPAMQLDEDVLSARQRSLRARESARCSEGVASSAPTAGGRPAAQQPRAGQRAVAEAVVDGAR